MLAADPVMPSQMLGPRRSQTPEERLLIAVLMEAVDCVEKYRAATDVDGRRLFSDVKLWLLAETTDWPYSFQSICDLMGLDAGAVRHRLGVKQARRRAVPPAIRRDICGSVNAVTESASAGSPALRSPTPS